MPLFQDISTPDFDRIREVLHRLAANPPQVLLLEGGTEPQRLAAARYWAACVNCQQPGGEGGPCLICPTCMQIDAGEHLDVLAYDGRISNADDEAHPGPIRALNMDNIRELKQKLHDAPHGQGRRVVLLMGVGQNRSNAANALLKALEEPSPSSCFVLLAAQREQLLPTLVSRSLCLTLPWPDSLSRDPALQPWEEALALFITSGRGLFECTGARNALDARLAAGHRVAHEDMARVHARLGQCVTHPQRVLADLASVQHRRARAGQRHRLVGALPTGKAVQAGGRDRLSRTHHMGHGQHNVYVDGAEIQNLHGLGTRR